MHNFWRQSQKWLLEQLTCRFAVILRPNHFPYEKVFGATAWGFKKVGVFRTFNVQMLPNSLLDTCTQTAHFVQNKTWRCSQFLKDLLLLFALAASGQWDDILCLDWKIWPPFQHLSRKPKDNQRQSKPMWSHVKPWPPGLLFDSVWSIHPTSKKTEEPNDFPGALVLGSDPPRCAPRSPGGVKRTVNTGSIFSSCHFGSSKPRRLTQLRGTLGLFATLATHLLPWSFETNTPRLHRGSHFNLLEIDSTTAYDCLVHMNAWTTLCQSWVIIIHYLESNMEVKKHSANKNTMIRLIWFIEPLRCQGVWKCPHPSTQRSLAFAPDGVSGWNMSNVGCRHFWASGGGSMREASGRTNLSKTTWNKCRGLQRCNSSWTLAPIK